MHSSYPNHTKTCLRLTAAALLLLLAACLGPVTKLYPADPALRPVPVYLTAHGWHVGIVVEAHRILPHLPPSPHYPDGLWLEFGWGDADYYPHPDPGLGVLLKAALLPTGAVMHIVGFDHPAPQRFPQSHTVPLQLSISGMQEPAEFLGTLRTYLAKFNQISTCRELSNPASRSFLAPHDGLGSLISSF
jgi:hypothetical protein